ncbi:MAG: hypothetical protein AAFY41_13390, partial [Bacteroidota bacterium]
IQDKAGNHLVGENTYEFVLNLSDTGTTPEVASIRLEEPISWNFNRDLNVEQQIPLTIRYSGLDIFDSEVDSIIFELRNETLQEPEDASWKTLAVYSKTEIESTLDQFGRTNGEVEITSDAFETISNGSYILRARVISNLLGETFVSNVLNGRVDTTKPYLVTVSPLPEIGILTYGEPVSFTFNEDLSEVLIDPANIEESDIKEVFSVSYLYTDENGLPQEQDITEAWIDLETNEKRSLVLINDGTVTFPPMAVSYFQDFIGGRVKFTLKGVRDELGNTQSNSESVIYLVDESSLASTIYNQVSFDCGSGLGSIEIVDTDDLLMYRMVSNGKLFGTKEGNGSSIYFDNLPAGNFALEVTDNSELWTKLANVWVEARDEVADPSELTISTTVPLDSIIAGTPVGFTSNITAMSYKWLFEWEGGVITSKMEQPLVIFPTGGIDVDVSLIASFESKCSI